MEGAFRHWKKIVVDEVYHKSNAPFMLRKNRPPPSRMTNLPSCDVKARIPIVTKTVLPPEPLPYVPVANFESYITDLEKQDPESAERLKTKQCEDVCGLITCDTSSRWSPPSEIHESLIRLNMMYYSKGVKPPIEERVMAFREAGYPDWYLVDMLKKDQNAKDNMANIDDFVFKIFGDVENKKVTAPKKKTLRQLLNIRGGVVPVKVDEDVIIDAEEGLKDGEM